MEEQVPVDLRMVESSREGSGQRGSYSSSVALRGGGRPGWAPPGGGAGMRSSCGGGGR